MNPVKEELEDAEEEKAQIEAHNDFIQDIKDHAPEHPPQSDESDHVAEEEIEEANQEPEKEPVVEEEEESPVEVVQPPQPGHEEDDYEEGQVDWWDFDDAAYLSQGALKPGEDPYQVFTFSSI